MSGLVQLRDYQRRAVNSVMRHWRDGTARRVCLVAPPGAGKTILGSEIVRRARVAGVRVIWIAHRRELIRQAADKLALFISPDDIAMVMPGEPRFPERPVQVASIDTILSSGWRPEASLLVWDECQHAMAPSYRTIADAYPAVRHLGLTATPERSDGAPLGDMFDELVIAASYSSLLKDGHLTNCMVYQPPEGLLGPTSKGLACDPVVAYQKYAEGSRAFCFCGTVEQAEEFSAAFNAAGIPAAVVEANTPTTERDLAMARFESGQLRVLLNVFVFSEGTNVPAARTCILARGFGHPSPFLQVSGRVLRPHPDKPYAIIIDLSEATRKHGMPTEDRVYSLSGAGIARTTSEKALATCLQCGNVWVPTKYPVVCPQCGWERPSQVERPMIYSADLVAVYAGMSTPDDAKRREYLRLRGVAQEKGWGIEWISKEYRRLFAANPTFYDVPVAERLAVYRKLQTKARAMGYKPGYAAARFRQLFGQWPPWDWRNFAASSCRDGQEE